MDPLKKWTDHTIITCNVASIIVLRNSINVIRDTTVCRNIQDSIRVERI